jgi:hypothetical protein
LRPKTFRTVIITIRAKWQELFLNVIGVIAKIRPRRVITISLENGIDSRDIRGCIGIGDIGAEVEEVGTTVTRIPVEFLPSVGRIIEGAAN